MHMQNNYADMAAHKALIAQAKARWQWDAFNKRKVEEAKMAAEDPFDVNMEKRIVANQHTPAITFEAGCRTGAIADGHR